MPRYPLKRGSQTYYRQPVRKTGNASEERYWKRQLIVSLSLILLLIALLWFGMLLFLNNIGTIWNTLRAGPTVSSPKNDSDTIAPSPPRLATLPQGSSKTTLDVQGFAEKESTVTLYVNGKKTTETKTSEKGDFRIESLTVPKGEVTIYATATDAAGNISGSSATQTVIIATEKPTLEVTEPADKAVFKGPQERTITVRGTTNPGTDIRVNDGVAFVNSEGDFSYTLSLHQNGDNTIKVTASDKAGNTIDKTLTVIYEEEADE